MSDVDPVAMAAAQVAAMGDQFIETMKPVLRFLGDYHAAAVGAGLSEAVADELVLRQATHFGFKDAPE